MYPVTGNPDENEPIEIWNCGELKLLVFSNILSDGNFKPQFNRFDPVSRNRFTGSGLKRKVS